MPQILKEDIKIDTRLLLHDGARVVVTKAWHGKDDAWLVTSVVERPYHAERDVELCDIAQIIS